MSNGQHIFSQPALPRCDDTELLWCLSIWKKAWRTPRLILSYAGWPLIQSDRHFCVGLGCTLCVLVCLCAHGAGVFVLGNNHICVSLLLFFRKEVKTLFTTCSETWPQAELLTMSSISSHTARTSAAPLSQTTAPLSLLWSSSSQNRGTRFV